MVLDQTWCFILCEFTESVGQLNPFCFLHLSGTRLCQLTKSFEFQAGCFLQECEQFIAPKHDFVCLASSTDGQLAHSFHQPLFVHLWSLGAAHRPLPKTLLSLCHSFPCSKNCHQFPKLLDLTLEVPLRDGVCLVGEGRAVQEGGIVQPCTGTTWHISGNKITVTDFYSALEKFKQKSD